MRKREQGCVPLKEEEEEVHVQCGMSERRRHGETEGNPLRADSEQAQEQIVEGGLRFHLHANAKITDAPTQS